MYLTTATLGDTASSEPLLVTSASDLTRASQCEFAVARDLDVRLGRIAAIDEAVDALLDRTSQLGDAHERAVIERYRESHTVVEIARPDDTSLDALAARATETEAALRAGADVVVQGTFLDLESDPGDPGEPGAGEHSALPIAFVGFADFLRLVSDPQAHATASSAATPTYRVQDTKLARRAKVTALLQLAAYAEQLQRLGIGVDPEVDLLLGNGETSIHRLDDIAPVLRTRRARLHRMLRARYAADTPIAWRDPSVTYCRSCAWCEHEIAQHDDVSRVAGLTGAQWQKLGAAGIETVGQLATHKGPVDGLNASTLDTLRLQAALQHEAAGAAPGTPPPVRVRDATALRRLPPPSPGDLYFDFEGDPLYTENDPSRWGLDYLFGMVDAGTETQPPRFTPYWAHDFAAERQALISFLADVEARRAIHPDLHIYHYAAYERTHLRSLAARHGVGEDTIDSWLREGVLVDLYPIVRGALRIGTPSYSIKYLEPLYWPEAREGAEVARGDDSVAEYVRSRELEAAGEHDAAQKVLDTIGDYNRVDCESTLRLTAWLRGLAAKHPVATPERDGLDGLDGAADPPADRAVPDSPLRTALLELAAGPDQHRPDGNPAVEPDRTPEQRAYAYAAAAIDYHRREHKTFWWDHFDRLTAPLDEWADARDVFTVDPSPAVDAPHEQSEWHKPTPRSSLSRTVRLRGAWSAGSRPSVGGRSGPYALYEQPAPFPPSSRDPGARSARSITLVEVHDDGVSFRETLPRGRDGAGIEPYTDLPVALTPAPPPDPGQQKPAIEEWGAALVAAAPELPRDAVVDLLTRRPPRTTSGRGLAPVVPDEHGEPGRIAAVTASLLDLDHSYLAVQGPPGTGKTYLGSHVIAELVLQHGWRVGVVAQGHATVEHLLNRIVDAGVPRNLVGKSLRAGDEEDEHTLFRPLAPGALADFTIGQPGGYVIGGTAWDLAHPERVGRRSLDLLVIDEAGQFSLAATIAASVSARNLLLLGDPQQLPQVSQGTHPEPIDGSALGYLSEGHDVLPAELGYFLAESHRMHPAVAEPVSHLSYEGQLHAHPRTAERMLSDTAPGVHPVAVPHLGNATDSEEEAAEVVRLVREHLGRAWRAGPEGTAARALGQRDIIVVTPYNAQQQLVHHRLTQAGFADVPVGTVDKFQGQEAAIAIVTLAASSPHEVPRGMEFLLNRNRLNVAISRAQWAAYLVHSPALVDYLPHTPHGVAELSAFLRLLET